MAMAPTAAPDDFVWVLILPWVVHSFEKRHDDPHGETPFEANALVVAREVASLSRVSRRFRDVVESVVWTEFVVGVLDAEISLKAYQSHVRESADGQDEGKSRETGGWFLRSQIVPWLEAFHPKVKPEKKATKKKRARKSSTKNRSSQSQKISPKPLLPSSTRVVPRLMSSHFDSYSYDASRFLLSLRFDATLFSYSSSESIFAYEFDPERSSESFEYLGQAYLGGGDTEWYFYLIKKPICLRCAPAYPDWGRISGFNSNRRRGFEDDLINPTNHRDFGEGSVVVFSLWNHGVDVPEYIDPYGMSDTSVSPKYPKVCDEWVKNCVEKPISPFSCDSYPCGWSSCRSWLKAMYPDLKCPPRR